MIREAYILHYVGSEAYLFVDVDHRSWYQSPDSPAQFYDLGYADSVESFYTLHEGLNDTWPQSITTHAYTARPIMDITVDDNSDKSSIVIRYAITLDFQVAGKQWILFDYELLCDEGIMSPNVTFEVQKSIGVSPITNVIVRALPTRLVNYHWLGRFMLGVATAARPTLRGVFRMDHLIVPDILKTRVKASMFCTVLESAIQMYHPEPGVSSKRQTTRAHRRK
nr:VP4 [Ulaatai Melophagus solemo-like virus]